MTVTANDNPTLQGVERGGTGQSAAGLLVTLDSNGNTVPYPGDAASDSCRYGITTADGAVVNAIGARVLVQVRPQNGSVAIAGAMLYPSADPAEPGVLTDDTPSSDEEAYHVAVLHQPVGVTAPATIGIGQATILSLSKRGQGPA